MSRVKIPNASPTHTSNTMLVFTQRQSQPENSSSFPFRLLVHTRPFANPSHTHARDVRAPQTIFHCTTLWKELRTPRFARKVLLPGEQAPPGIISGAKGLQVDKHPLAPLVIVQQQLSICGMHRQALVAAYFGAQAAASSLLEYGGGGGGWGKTGIESGVLGFSQKMWLSMLVSRHSAIGLCAK